MPTRKDNCFVEKLQIKIYSSVTLSIERLSGRTANIELEKKKMTEADRRHSWHTLEERKKGPFVNFECII